MVPAKVVVVTTWERGLSKYAWHVKDKEEAMEEADKAFLGGATEVLAFASDGWIYDPKEANPEAHICPSCGGSGEYVAQGAMVKDGDHCCLADVVCVCQECNGTGRI